MRIYPRNLFADAKEERRQGERAFTMIEIAIAIGVIGFALVAVIGILPTGMNAQKDNREDMTISQDAPIFMDAIRNGASLTNFGEVNQGLDFLTNYVEEITLIGFTNGVQAPPSYTETYTKNFRNGSQIVGLLSTPEGLYVSSSNYTITRAFVRSLSGAAVQQNGANLATTFRYQMDVEIVPFVNVAPDTTNYSEYVRAGYSTNSPEVLNRYYRYLELDPFPSFTLPVPAVTNLPYGVGALAFSCFDVKLRFSWPVIAGPNGYIVGPNHQTYRTTVASSILPGIALNDGAQLWFFQPQSYTNFCTIARY
jgi:type II secretory pathway pseudopilin PulG